MNNDLLILLIIAVILALGSGYYVLSHMTDTCDRIIKKCNDLIKFIKKNK
jgi:prefoldin subunit 5